MTEEELKIHHLAGHHLLAPVDGKTVVRDLCGVQAQFFSNAVHAVKIRGGALETDPAGYIKSWTVRGTMHVFAAEDLSLFLHRDRDHFLRPRDTLETDECISRERKRYFADVIVEQIAAGAKTREALRQVCFDRGMTEREAESVFDPWGGTVRALCEAGVMAYEAGEKKIFRLCQAFEPMEREAARLEMARRYFTHYGPATVKDAAYFFAAKQAEVKSWLSRLPVTAAEYGGRTYYSIDSGENCGYDIPECIFLAGFDPLMLGYEKRESVYLPPEHLRKIFSLAGIVSPALLLRGNVAGKWKRTGKKVTVTPFESLTRKDKVSIEACAHGLWPELRSVEYI